ncbi:UDP-glucose 4-epimerase GalE [Terribacillus saccharophilus]|uniref:UDP-glucose 4-epimerase GalE n=1 Tax=Terribacillus saccharophilus TaxID=361277 RepID=UPI000BA763DF|nr:UDP-glucose 4-epimerase GalE [Terribacillus saccharophilus]PAF40425.1 UDP-glucose 4-epimerase GalE [Terribacillus saccharophilus]
MKVLVTGGAGYIGSHAVSMLLEKGHEAVIIDNVITGHLAAVNKDAVFYEGDLRDAAFLDDVFTKEKVDAVVHFAASSLVGESVEDPLKYFGNNVYGMQVLLETMRKHEVKKIVFSSTAATYGDTNVVPLTEDLDTNPESPYGESKLMMEKMMKWCDRAYGIKFVSLRYFNVGGAHPEGQIGEDHRPESHLIPIILQTALGQREHISIFGDDYPTEDGTCIRDYIHVVDLIDAHLLALEYLDKGGQSDVFNLGSSQGFSVKEMIDVARSVTGKEIPAKVGPRRAGDPAVLIASSAKAKEVLGWNPTRTDMTDIIGDAWRWHQNRPNGYDA